MKKLFLLIGILIPFNLFSQYTNVDEYKQQRKSYLKSDILPYYNALLNKYDIHFVMLDLEVSDTSTYIKGNARIEAKVISKLDTLVLDLHQSMIIDSFFINNSKLTTSHTNNQVQYIFNVPLSIGDNFKVQIYYHGIPSQQGGVTNKKSTKWDKNVTWTLSESFHAYEWWPCKQVLSDKIDSTYFHLTCDSDCIAGSNGLLKNIVTLPNGKKRFEWQSNYPISYYLISFAVSEYQDYSIYAHPNGSDSILIQNFIYNTNNCLNTFKSGIDNTVDFIELFSEKFGLYPFAKEKYGHCLVELGGGMEHQTMTTLGNFGYTLVAHELAHMWFGDNVTCASWQDIWINEGFASYSEYVALENLETSIEAQNWMSYAHSLAIQELDGSVYIPFEDSFNESRIFNYALTYKKGAAIIHTLRHEINNDALFFSIIRDYLTHYSNTVATGEDFKNFVELKTGDDFDPFFNQWYFGKGFPRFDIEYAQIKDTLYLEVTETTSSSQTPLFQMHVDYTIFSPDGDTTLRLLQTKNNERFEIPLKRKITKIITDPENWILNKPGTVTNVGLIDNNGSLFKIFPNPVHEKLTLDFNINLLDKEKFIEIFDVHGRLILNFKSNNAEATVNLTNLANGIYLIKTSSENNSFTHTFIKQ